MPQRRMWHWQKKISMLYLRESQQKQTWHLRGPAGRPSRWHSSLTLCTLLALISCFSKGWKYWKHAWNCQESCCQPDQEEKKKQVTTSPKNIHQPTRSIMSTRHPAIQGYYLALQIASDRVQNQLLPTFKGVSCKNRNPQTEEASLSAQRLVSSCSASLPLSACISV